MSVFLAVRILVAEDFLAFRQFILSVLEIRPEWDVVYEATDGLEAVRKAEELQPDVILLDIGLPNLNGIKAAMRISARNPNCKMLFLSQESSPAVVRKALSTGARGYVLKSEAQKELLAAIEALVQGQCYISSSLRSELRLQEFNRAPATEPSGSMDVYTREGETPMHATPQNAR